MSWPSQDDQLTHHLTEQYSSQEGYSYHGIRPSSPRSQPDASFCKRTFRPMGPGSLRGAIFSLSASALGAGILSLPYAFSNCGIVLGLILILLGGSTFSLYYKVLVRALELKEKDTFVGLIESLYGQVWRRISELFLICMLFGAMSAYQTIIAQFLLSVSEKSGIIPTYYSHETYRVLFTIGVTVCILIPLSLAKNITSLRYLTIVCVISIIYVTLLVVIQTPLYMNTMHNSIYDITLFKLDTSIADTVSIIVFAFNAVTCIPVIYSELYMSNYRRMTKVINRSVLLSGFMYIILGVFGYLSYCSDMPGLVTNRGSVEGPGVIDWPMEVAKVLISCALCGTVAIANNSLRISMEQMIAGTEPDENEVRYWTINFGMLLGIMMVAIMLPDAVMYFKILGGIFGVPLSIILPSNSYIAVIYWTISKNYPLLGLVTLWSGFISVLGIFSVVKTFIL